MIGQNSWKLCFIIELNNCLWFRVFLRQQPKTRGGGATFLETLFYHRNKQKSVVQGS